MHVLLPLNWINPDIELQTIEESKQDHANRTNSDTNFDASDKTALLPKWVMESNQINELCNKICLYLANPKGLDKLDAYLKGLKVENRLLIKGNWL